MRAALHRVAASLFLGLSAAVAAAAAGQNAPAANGIVAEEIREGFWVGTWANMNNTMHIRASRCGNDMCGEVIWASEEAKANVAKRGRTLIGAQLFRDFRQTAPNQWSGKVFIPDLGRAVSGKVMLTDRDSITAVGCLVGPFGCQTRHWRRIR